MVRRSAEPVSDGYEHARTFPAALEHARNRAVVMESEAWRWTEYRGRVRVGRCAPSFSTRSRANHRSTCASLASRDKEFTSRDSETDQPVSVVRFLGDYGRHTP